MLQLLPNPASSCRDVRRNFVWDWRALTLLLAVAMGSWSGLPAAGGVRATEENSQGGEEEQTSAQSIELCEGRSSSGRATHRQAGSKPLVRMKASQSSGDSSSGNSRGVVYREGHYLPCGVNAPRRC